LEVDLDMSQNYSLEAVLKIVVYGVPGLLIVLGFFGYLTGSAIELATRDTGLRDLGILLMALGIIFYVIELIITVHDYFTGS
jgi:hypothetical protein